MSVTLPWFKEGSREGTAPQLRRGLLLRLDNDILRVSTGKYFKFPLKPSKFAIRDTYNP